MARKLRRYKYKDLPRLSRQQADVVNALLLRLPQTPFEHDFKQRLRQELEPLVHVELDFWLEHVRSEDVSVIIERLPEPCCIGMVSLQPSPHYAVLEMDLTVAQQAIDRLLGGNAEDFDGQRPLSEIEEGIFSFLLLKVLRLMQSDFGSEQQVSLKLAGIVGNKENLQSRLRDYRSMVTLSFKFFFDGEAGFAKIHLPTEWVNSELASHVPLEGPALSRSLRRIQEVIPRVAAIEVPLQVEVGRVPFGLADLESIEPGDIVLIEGAQVQLAEDQVTGPVRCQVGEGKHGFIEGTLMVGETGAYEVVIEQIVALPEPAAAGGISSNGIDEEYAMTLSKAHPQSADISQRILAALARQGARGSTRPLTASAPDSVTDEGWGYEHSDGEYGDDGYGEEAEDDEPLPESAAMLADVSVPMVVEMGRVKVSASDIVGLRPGQVIELSRSPGDAVDLVVDGRRIGRGELVDIEGELGVRILDLAR